MTGQLMITDYMTKTHESHDVQIFTKTVTDKAHINKCTCRVIIKQSFRRY